MQSSRRIIEGVAPKGFVVPCFSLNGRSSAAGPNHVLRIVGVAMSPDEVSIWKEVGDISRPARFVVGPLVDYIATQIDQHCVRLVMRIQQGQTRLGELRVESNGADRVFHL